MEEDLIFKVAIVAGEYYGNVKLGYCVVDLNTAAKIYSWLALDEGEARDVCVSYALSQGYQVILDEYGRLHPNLLWTPLEVFWRALKVVHAETEELLAVMEDQFEEEGDDADAITEGRARQRMLFQILLAAEWYLANQNRPDAYDRLKEMFSQEGDSR